MKTALLVTRFVFSSMLLTWFLALGANAQNLTISSSGQTGTSGTNWSLSNVSIGQTFGNSTLSNGATCLTSGPLWFTPTTSGFITQIELSSWSSGETASLVIKSQSPCGSPVILGTSNTLTTVAGWNTWTFATPVPVTANTTYFITSDNATACLGVRWAQSGDDPTTGKVQNGFPFGCTLSNTDPATRIFVSPTAAVQQYANLSVTGTASIHASVLETALANRDLNVVGNTNNFQVSVDQNISVNAGTGNLTFGSSTTTGSFTLNNPITLSGALSVYGGDITVNGNINTTAGNANGDILFKASGDIVQSASKTITTNGGNAIFWANSDGATTNGSVLLRNQSSITTNGGHVWMGGGSGSTSWNGLTVGNGLAVSGTTYSTPVSSAIYESGIYLEKATIQSGGGNVYLAGSSAGTDGSYDFGILTHDVSSINSGLGTITIKGGTGSSTVRGMVVGVQYSNQPGSLTLTSASTQATAIDVDLRSASNFGLAFEGEFSLISTQSGGINFTTIGSTAGTRLGFSTNPGALNVLAASGPIVVNTGASGFDKGLTTSTIQKAFFGAKAGTSVTSSSSNIQFISDDLDELDELNFATSGTLIVEPSGTSFATALNSSSLIQTGLSGLTLGKAGNTSAITIGSAATIAGPVSVYGGNITVDGNINTSAGNANGDILFKGTGNITQNAGKTITTTGGDVIFWSDSDGNNDGMISISSNITTNGGHLWMGGGNGSATWNGLSVGNGFATGNATNSNGLYMVGSTLSTAGGNVAIYGKSRAGNAISGVTGNTNGVRLLNGNTINSGTGTIYIKGYGQGTSGSSNGIEFSGATADLITSANTTSDAIILDGETVANPASVADGWGIYGWQATIQATADGGGVSLLGKGSKNNGVTIPASAAALAKSGPIKLIGSGFGTGFNSVEIAGVVGAKTGTGVTVSSSSIEIKGDTFKGSSGSIVSSGQLVFESIGTSFSSTFSLSNLTLSNALTGLTLGKTTNTSGVTLGTAATIAGPITLHGGALAINAAATATNSTINLNATGAVTQTAALTANNLALGGSGTFTLTNAGNNIATLAAGDNTTAVGNISFTDASGGLTIGTVGNKSGILSSGTVSVETLAGDLTLAQNVGTTNNSASAVTLNAGKGAAIGTTTGGDILVTGSPTLTTGTGGIAKLFSGSDGGSTGLISLVGGAVNARLGVDETTTSFSPVLGAGGSYALFRALSNAPVFTNLSGDAVSYVLENNPVALDANANAQVSDSDSPDFNGGVLTVSFASNTGIPAEDRLGITNQGSGAGQIGVSGTSILFEGVALGTFTGGTSGANLVITLNATATSTSVAALLRALNYSNSNTTLSIGSGNRQVAITLTDGDGGISATATVTVSIITSRTLSVLSGNNQTASVNQALPSGPVLRVMGSNGVPAANATLSVTANAGQIRLPVLSNLSDTYTTGGSLIDNINWKAHQFTTGNTAVILDQVALLLNKVAAASYPSTVQVEAAIYTVNNFGVPGIEIGTSGIQSALLPAATTWKTMVFSSPIELSPNTNYALVVKGSNSTGFNWGNVRSGSTGPTGWAAFVSSKTTDGSITNWVDGAVRNAFILTGSTPLSATQTLVTNSDGTAALGSWILGDRAGTQELVVSNGTLQGSPLTISATATAVVPSAPTNLSYSPGNGQVILAFTPGYDGGLTLTNYEYSLDNGSSWTALNPVDTSSPVTIPGLTNGVTYPVKIRAVNAVGQGAASAVISVNSVISLTNQSITVDPIANQTYTGSALTPAVVVKDGNTTLTATTDYTVAYTNNTNVGTATVTITGVGNYTGTKTQTFTIGAKAASTLTIDAIANQTYTGSALTPVVVVKDGNTTLTATTDYTVAYTNNTNVGTATVTITGVGNYSGTKTQTFTIGAKAASTLTIDAIANQTYTGSALTPAVVVKDGNTTLTAMTDYTVAYTANTNVGTATVTITGVGNYSGTKTQTFTIGAKAASTLTIDAIANQTYTGSALTPVVVVKDSNTTLTATTDYAVAYTNNTNVGTATVTITGVGNYSGTKTQTFTIVAKAASSLTIDAIANQTYTGSALTPVVVVKDGNTTLTATTDYTVAYTNNTNVGTATVTITGAGNYTGTKTQTFTIVAKAASSLTIDAIANQTYTGSALTPVVVVKDGNTTLTATTDYTVAYTNNTNVGTATVTITGVGSYSGTKSQTFVIQPKALTIRAVNATKIYGDANPSLGFTYSGLVDGDTEIDQVPSISTTATTTSGVGTYRIILTGGSDPNYTLTRVEGVLEVTPASLSLTVNGATKIYGQADPVYTYNIQGLKGADTEAVLRGTLSREAGEEPGTYRIGAGTLSAGANYSLTVTGANLQIVKARALAVAELGLITTEWSKEAALPATVNVLTTHGQYFRVDVKWDKTTLNLLARGTYALTGTLMLPSGIENPDQVLAEAQVRVLPKEAPLDLTLNNSSFVGSSNSFFIPVGAFVVNDPVDKVHVVSLNGPGYDNTYFEIKDNILFWSSADLAAGKTKFSIIVRVTDRDGNTLDKFFEITRTRPSVSEIIIYNSFTPNGDGFNDTWGILDLQFYEGARISIYERGGSRVFYTEKPTIRWDGTFEGKKLPVGTYFWIVEVTETGEVRKGMLNVMRK